MKAPRPFYMEALSGLASAYIDITLDQSRGCPLPLRREQHVEEVEGAWHARVTNAGGGAGVAADALAVQELARARRAEDTLEDVMFWVGQLAEAYPEFADKVGLFVCCVCACARLCVCVYVCVDHAVHPGKVR